MKNTMQKYNIFAKLPNILTKKRQKYKFCKVNIAKSEQIASKMYQLIAK